MLRHSLLPSDSDFSVQTQYACGTYLLQPSPHWCNPALFAFADDATIKADLAISADQDAYDTTNRFLNQPITKAFVEDLFKKKDFQSFSGLARLEALSPYLSFSYVPMYVVGAYQIFNPNLPEVSAAAARESQARVTSGRRIVEFSGWSLYGGASLFLFDRKVYYVHANALELAVKDIGQFVETDHQTGVNADAGLFLKPNADGLPSFSLVGENLFLAQRRPIDNDRILDLDPQFRRRMRVETGYTLVHATGTYFLGAQAPFWDAFREFDRYGASLAFAYGIGRLRAFTSFSPLMATFGFIFMSTFYHVGIEYTDDKQDNSLELQRHKDVYLFASFNF